MTDELRPIDAVKAMRARGVDNAEELLQYASLEAIRGACEWWDRKPSVGAGLLAKKIREGGIDPEPRPEPGTVVPVLREAFVEYMKHHPIGSSAGAHADLHHPRWPDDPPCRGAMVILDAEFPVATLECAECGFEMGLPVRGMRQLSGQERSRNGWSNS